MDKSILKELNRTREIMGLNLLSEEELKNNNNVALKEDIEEMDMDEMDMDEMEEMATMDEMDDEVVKEQEEDEVEGEEEVKINPNAIVTKYKDVYFGQNGMDIGVQLVYKFNKEAKEPVPGSSMVRWSDYGDLISNRDEFKPVKDWKYSWDKDRQMYTKLRDEYPANSKTGISTILKKVVARKAEELGLDIGDVNELFASFSEFDPSRYVPRHSVQKKGSFQRSQGEKGLYMGYQLNRKKRSGEQDAPENFSNFVLEYRPKEGGKDVRVSFYKNGKLSSSEDRWGALVQGIKDRDEMYEFCQTLPDDLKNAKDWKQTSTGVRGSYDRRNSITC